MKSSSILSKWVGPNTASNEQTKITPGHKSPYLYLPHQQQQQQQQELTPQLELSLGEELKPLATTSADIQKYRNENDEHNNLLFERTLHPHIGLNPFLNGNTYLNDINVQNTLLRGAGGRD